MNQILPTQLLGPNQLPVSRIALGCAGLSGTWNAAEFGSENRRKAILAFEAALEAGITFFDHADFYGDYTCEIVFKDCLEAVPGIRDSICIATKVGIGSGNGNYNHSPEHIRKSIRESLDRMGIDYVDLYQLHRPDPLTHPAVVAETLDSLVEEGLVRAIGISNYYPHQTLALEKYLQTPIVSNQIAISLLRLDPIYEGAAGAGGDGVLDQCEELDITPLAFSPLGEGWLGGRREIPADHPKKAKIERILASLREVGAEYGDATPAQIALAWLLAHPADILPLVGSTNPEHIREAAGATAITLSRAHWYKLWNAARDESTP